MSISVIEVLVFVQIACTIFGLVVTGNEILAPVLVSGIFAHMALESSSPYRAFLTILSIFTLSGWCSLFILDSRRMLYMIFLVSMKITVLLQIIGLLVKRFASFTLMDEESVDPSERQYVPLDLSLSATYSVYPGDLESGKLESGEVDPSSSSTKVVRNKFGPFDNASTRRYGLRDDFKLMLAPAARHLDTNSVNPWEEAYAKRQREGPNPKRKKLAPKVGCPPWKNMIPELLQQIIHELPFTDYVRFSAVCTNWENVQRITPPQLKRQVPMILFPLIMKMPRNSRLMYSPSENKYYRIELPNIKDNMTLCGTSHGRMVFLDLSNQVESLLQIVNPLSGIEEVCTKIATPITGEPISVLSCSPTHSKSVLFVWSSRSFVYHISDGKTIISKVPRRYMRCGNPVSFHDKFYLMTEIDGSYSRGRKLVILETTLPILKATEIEMLYPESEFSCGNYEFLVTCEDTLLLVRMSLRRRKIIKFEIYSADLSQKVWNPLLTLGRYALFITCNIYRNPGYCFSLDTDNRDVHKNTIYFTGSISMLENEDHFSGRLWLEYDYARHQVVNGIILPTGHQYDEKNDTLQWIMPTI